MLVTSPLTWKGVGMPLPKAYGVPRIIAEFEYFNVKRLPRVKGRKTHVFQLINRKSGFVLGEIKWHGKWRNYCFFPSGNSIWSKGCLECVQEFLRDLREDREGQEEAPDADTAN